jgi:alpha-glucuronidase
MPKTPLMMEFQITQEYLGFSTHLAYLGELYEEVLDAETGRGPGEATVADVVDGSLHGGTLTGIAGVANIGSDRNWSGSIFAQSNWYAFGRLAWDPELSARAIAEEWLRQTLSRDPRFVAAAADMMMRSREAVVDYMTPLGLAHLMGTGHHYGPAPWVDELARPEWNPYYYHRASPEGIGFDRTASGSDAIAQYSALLRERYANVATTPEKLLLWFHRLPWDYEMRSGKTLWQELVAHYDRGVAEVMWMQDQWRGLESYIDEERAQQIAAFLGIQAREARWWRDACIAYFMEVSGQALPRGARKPEKSLEYYRGLEFPYAPGN